VDPWVKEALIGSIEDVDPASADPQGTTFWDVNALTFRRYDGTMHWKLRRTNLRSHEDYDDATRNEWFMNYDDTYASDGTVIRERLHQSGKPAGSFILKKHRERVEDVSWGPLNRVWEFGVPVLVRDSPPAEFFDPVLKLKIMDPSLCIVRRAFIPSATGVSEISAQEFIKLDYGGKSTGLEVFNPMKNPILGKRSLLRKNEYLDYAMIDTIWLPKRIVERAYQSSRNQAPGSDPELSQLTEVTIIDAHLNTEISSRELEISPEIGDEIIDQRSESDTP
jgi:hypothetical protein